MVSERRAPTRLRARELSGIPVGDLERIRDFNRKYRGWIDEWDFIRDAVRRRLDECGQKYPDIHLA